MTNLSETLSAVSQEVILLESQLDGTQTQLKTLREEYNVLANKCIAFQREFFRHGYKPADIRRIIGKTLTEREV